jgi:hypothetical protein
VVGAFRSTSSSIILGFNGVVGFSAFPKVIATTNETSIAGQWYAITIPSSSTPLYGTKHSSSSAWLFVSDQQQLQSDEKWALRIQSNEVYPISSAMSVEPDHIWTEPVKATDALGNCEEDKSKKYGTDASFSCFWVVGSRKCDRDGYSYYPSWPTTPAAS